MLCTPGFMDDVMFSSSGLYERARTQRCETGAESDVYECLVLLFIMIYST